MSQPILGEAIPFKFPLGFNLWNRNKKQRIWDYHRHLNQCVVRALLRLLRQNHRNQTCLRQSLLFSLTCAHSLAADIGEGRENRAGLVQIMEWQEAGGRHCKSLLEWYVNTKRMESCAERQMDGLSHHGMLWQPGFCTDRFGERSGGIKSN